MDLGIRGRIAFVAGGSKGMGRAVADLLADEGCRVAIVARGRDAIDQAVSELNGRGADVIGIAADLGTEDGVTHAVNAVRAAFGPPEIMVAQTNDMTHGYFNDVRPDDYERVFRVLTMSVVWLARAVLPDMQKAGWGRIVHIGSAVSKEPQRDMGHIVHNTVRPATTSLMKSMSNEYAKYGITVNSVAPGYILTDTMRDYFRAKMDIPTDELEHWLQTARDIPAERPGTTHEFASMVAFLCSRDAAYVNGELICVDGGWHRSAV